MCKSKYFTRKTLLAFLIVATQVNILNADSRSIAFRDNARLLPFGKDIYRRIHRKDSSWSVIKRKDESDSNRKLESEFNKLKDGAGVLPSGAETVSLAAIHVETLPGHGRSKRGLTNAPKGVMKIVTSKMTLTVTMETEDELFSPDFSAISVTDKVEEILLVDTNRFMKGKLLLANGTEAESSDVSLHVSADGELTMRVKTDTDVIYIEPAQKYNGKGQDIVLYKESQFPSANTGKELDLNEGEMRRRSASDGIDLSESLSRRDRRLLQKRSVNNKRNVNGLRNETLNENISMLKIRCGLHLYADYSYYKNIGEKHSNGSATRANAIVVASMIERIQRVNSIYKRHTFNRIKGWGFHIDKVTVLKSFEPRHEDNSGAFHHFIEDHDFDNSARELLLAFFQSHHSPDICLSHLFTYHDFGTTMGIAQTGGICSSMNIGLSNFLYTSPEQGDGTDRQADLALAHELGHNWGASHDPEEPECRPDDGLYLMFPDAAAYIHVKNNEQFSPCSVRSINSVLESKSDSCFQPAWSSKHACGNGIREGDEKCDRGHTSDRCCTMDCQLASGSQCSPNNHACCTDHCQLIPPEPCSRMVMPHKIMLEKETGVIKSSNYPETYPAKERREWYITVPVGHVIEFRLNDIEIEPADGSDVYDYLEIFDEIGFVETNRLGMFSGFYYSNEPFLTDSRHATVLFISDDSIQYRGFKVEFTAIYREEPILVPSMTTEYETTTPYEISTTAETIVTTSEFEDTLASVTTDYPVTTTEEPYEQTTLRSDWVYHGESYYDGYPINDMYTEEDSFADCKARCEATHRCIVVWYFQGPPAWKGPKLCFMADRMLHRKRNNNFVLAYIGEHWA